MKQVLPVLILLFLLTSAFAQTQRTVLLEEFTNASCDPCEAQNPNYNALIETNRDRIVSVKYQTPFPGYDPYYYDVPDAVSSIIDSKLQYYAEITGVPSIIIDGTFPDDSYANGVGLWERAYPGAPFGLNQAALNYGLSFMSPVAMNISFEAIDSTDPIGIQATVQVINTMPDTLDLSGHVINVFMVEEQNLFPEPPGTTSEREFFDIFRGAITAPAGDALTQMLAPGDTLSLSYNTEYPDYIYSIAQLGLVSYIQSSSDRSVVQSARARAKDFPMIADGSITGNIQTAASNCDYSASANFNVRNLSVSADITSFQAVVSDQNGNILANQLFTRVIEPGRTQAFAFDDFTEVGAGYNTYRLSLTEVNGEVGDLNVLDNFSSPIETVKWQEDAVYTEAYTYDFENLEAYEEPANSYLSIEQDINTPSVMTTAELRAFYNFLNANVGETTPVPTNAGGYGMSDNFLYLGFLFWNPANRNASETWAIDKVDMTDRENSVLHFDINHATYASFTNNVDNGVEVFVSTDCGETLEPVYAKFGSDLATTSPTDQFYAPDPAAWRTDSIDLSAYDGFDGINIVFQFTSDWGNNAFMDNVVVSSDLASNNNELEIAQSVNLFPNPTVDNSIFSVELIESTRANLTVSDITGKAVQTVFQNRNISAGSHEFKIETRNLNTGVYLVRFDSAEGQVMRKLTVTR